MICPARATQVAASRALPVAGPQVEEMKSQRPQERVDVSEERLIRVDRSEFDLDLDARDRRRQRVRRTLEDQALAALRVHLEKIDIADRA